MVNDRLVNDIIAAIEQAGPEAAGGLARISAEHQAANTAVAILCCVLAAIGLLGVLFAIFSKKASEEAGFGIGIAGGATMLFSVLIGGQALYESQRPTFEAVKELISK